MDVDLLRRQASGREAAIAARRIRELEQLAREQAAEVRALRAALELARRIRRLTF